MWGISNSLQDDTFCAKSCLPFDWLPARKAAQKTVADGVQGMRTRCIQDRRDPRGT
jgi:hypothetical protein